MVNRSKPWWWKPLWISVILSAIALGVVGYILWHVPLERLAGGLALTLFCISISYYIRIKPSMRVNRVLYILLGISPIGFSLWILIALSGIGKFLATLGPCGILASMLLLPIPYIIGVFIGDWIGRKRNYRLPLSPFS
ncbi:MAG: hypothetical protein OEX09_01375 [Candidatus Bathyarchaeota archaeon]|nr:hypothetical protein [Candidatus Bathyarchaeota archaeon]